MRTYTHGVIGYLLYAKRSRTERRLAAVGGVLPDAIVGLGFVFHVAEPWTSLAIVGRLHALLHLSPLHTVTVALHSFVVIGPLLALAWLFRRGATPLFVGMLSHGVVDLLTHRTWAYNHFFPIPLSPIRGAVSYTDSWFTILEHAALLLFIVWFIAKRRARPSAPPPGSAPGSKWSTPHEGARTGSGYRHAGPRRTVLRAWIRTAHQPVARGGGGRHHRRDPVRPR